jgi:hypothetical protein
MALSELGEMLIEIRRKAESANQQGQGPDEDIDAADLIASGVLTLDTQTVIEELQRLQTSNSRNTARVLGDMENFRRAM